jgi:hypothetical protein
LLLITFSGVTEFIGISTLDFGLGTVSDTMEYSFFLK